MAFMSFNTFALSTNNSSEKSNDTSLKYNVLLYSGLESKLYLLNKDVTEIKTGSATKDELRAYHSSLLSFKKDLDTVNDVVTSRLNDIFFWSNLFFSIFTILFVVGGFFVISNNKKVAKESVIEWCEDNLKHERDKFKKELNSLTESSIEEVEGAMLDMKKKIEEVGSACEDAKAEMAKKIQQNNEKTQTTTKNPSSQVNKQSTTSQNESSPNREQSMQAIKNKLYKE